MADEKRLLAVYLDFENLALGFRGQNDRFDISRVIDRLVEKGTLVVKRAYADWKRFSTYAGPLQEHAFELMQIPARRLTGKNSADMRLCVDAMDICYSKAHINSFVIVSGDSDFSPLVSKLRENGRQVIGLGMRDSTSSLLRDNCDEFIYYEDLEAEKEEVIADLPDGNEHEQELYSLLLESLQALRRENREVLWASMVKETMKRKRPSFNEGYFGFRSFSELLSHAEKKGLLTLERDNSRRTHIVTAFGDEVSRGRRAAVTPGPAARRSARDEDEPTKERASDARTTKTSKKRPVAKKAASARPPASKTGSSGSGAGRATKSTKATSRSDSDDDDYDDANESESDAVTGRRRRRRS